MIFQVFHDFKSLWEHWYDDKMKRIKSGVQWKKENQNRRVHCSSGKVNKSGMSSFPLEGWEYHIDYFFHIQSKFTSGDVLYNFCCGRHLVDEAWLMRLAHRETGLSPSVKYFYRPFQGGASFVDHLCYLCLGFCYAFVRVCRLTPRGHLLGKG